MWWTRAAQVQPVKVRAINKDIQYFGRSHAREQEVKEKKEKKRREKHSGWK